MPSIARASSRTMARTLCFVAAVPASSLRRLIAASASRSLAGSRSSTSNAAAAYFARIYVAHDRRRHRRRIVLVRGDCMRDVARNAGREHRLGTRGEIADAGVRERVGKAHGVHQALIGDDAVDGASGILGMGRGVERDAVGDRLGDVRHGHAAAVARLEASAVAAAVIDEVDPRLACARGLGVVERACDEAREVALVAHDRRRCRNARRRRCRRQSYSARCGAARTRRRRRPPADASCLRR